MGSAQLEPSQGHAFYESMSLAAAGDGHLLTQWTDRLQRLNECKAPEADPIEKARHEGYRVALAQCIADTETLYDQADKDAELHLGEPPQVWKQLTNFGNGGVYKRRWKGADVTVIRSVGPAVDGQSWIHVSVSRPDRCPAWSEMAEVKADFIGDRDAVQVSPRASKHINIHKNCLHWWAPVTSWPLPDFTWGGQQV